MLTLLSPLAVGQSAESGCKATAFFCDTTKSPGANPEGHSSQSSLLAGIAYIHCKMLIVFSQKLPAITLGISCPFTSRYHLVLSKKVTCR